MAAEVEWKLWVGNILGRMNLQNLVYGVGGSGRKLEKFTIILRFKVWTINKTLVN